MDKEWKYKLEEERIINIKEINTVIPPNIYNVWVIKSIVIYHLFLIA